jgi:hypothetical protein
VPELTAWADNANYTIYASPSGCCTENNNWTQIRSIDRRYDLDPPQQLEINVYSGGYGPMDKACMLDGCRDGQHDEMLQYANCHIFYNGSAIWEWYPQFQTCTKLIEGAGMPRGTWFKDSGTNVYVGEETLADVPDITANRTCHLFCSGGDTDACMQEGPNVSSVQAFWIYEDGRPCKHHFPNGQDQYQDFIETPELTGHTLYDDGTLPSYCPSWDTPSLLPAQFPNQDNVCTAWWFNVTEAIAALLLIK